ncbi:hypothetical protein BG257_15690 [Proteus mirabilis]|nr:hypothetical protein BB2000_1198 [Proteus mirabilis BB2000]ALE22154.1 hypothetical protein AOC00_07855 [Proteus mirabilis]OFV20373.1 hypothetical protein HMPREF3129_05785 [Proteus sp. HMSC14B05]ALE25295.1 hypothetical protein AOB99_07875 [Proteus mirabilis]ATC75979.1 hypothetical protein BG257_15690 [Proteus mirabilis]
MSAKTTLLLSKIKDVIALFFIEMAVFFLIFNILLAFFIIDGQFDIFNITSWFSFDLLSSIMYSQLVS